MSAVSPAPPGARFSVLDGLRGLAILLVVTYHYTVRWTPPEDPLNHWPAASVFGGLPVVEQFGFAGVSLFFIVSGFVILMTLERSRSIVDFVIRRLARLWPPMIAGCTITALVVLAIGPADWRPTFFEYFFSLLFIPPALIGEAIGKPGIYTWVDGVYWTLFVEVRFYVLAALIWWWRPEWALWLVVAWATVGLGLFLLIAPVSPVGGQIVELFTFARQAAYFALGVAAYRYWAGSRTRSTLAAIILCVLLTFVIAGPSWSRAGLNVAALSLVAVAMTVPDRKLGPLARGPLPFVGKISYSLYLLHQMIGVSVLIVLTEFGWPLAAAIPLVVAGALVLSWLLFRGVEMPARVWLTSVLEGLAHRLLTRWPGLAFRRGDDPARAP